MPDLNEILEGAKDDAKELSVDVILRVGDWIEANVRATGSLDAVAFPPAPAVSVDLDGLKLDNALATLDKVRKSLSKKLAAKEKGEQIAEAVLLGVMRIALGAAVTAI